MGDGYFHSLTQPPQTVRPVIFRADLNPASTLALGFLLGGRRVLGREPYRQIARAAFERGSGVAGAFIRDGVSIGRVGASVRFLVVEADADEL